MRSTRPLRRLRSGIPMGTGLLTTNRWRTGWPQRRPIEAALSAPSIFGRWADRADDA